MSSVLKWLRERRTFICMSLLMVSVISVAHDMYVNKPVPPSASFATPDELIPSVLRHKTIRIADLVREDFVIRNKTFEDCYIYGPAIIIPDDKCRFRNFVIGEVALDGAFIATPNKLISGAIGFENCVVIDCHFRKISFIGPQDLMDYLRRSIKPQPAK